jgi:hypothetical protein
VTQVPPAALDFTAASMKATPSTPSSTVGNVTAGSTATPERAARIARAASV